MRNHPPTPAVLMYAYPRSLASSLPDAFQQHCQVLCARLTSAIAVLAGRPAGELLEFTCWLAEARGHFAGGGAAGSGTDSAATAAAARVDAALGAARAEMTAEFESLKGLLELMRCALL